MVTLNKSSVLSREKFINACCDTTGLTLIGTNLYLSKIVISELFRTIINRNEKVLYIYQNYPTQVINCASNILSKENIFFDPCDNDVYNVIDKSSSVRLQKYTNDIIDCQEDYCIINLLNRKDLKSKKLRGILKQLKHKTVFIVVECPVEKELSIFNKYAIMNRIVNEAFILYGSDGVTCFIDRLSKANLFIELSV